MPAFFLFLRNHVALDFHLYPLPPPILTSLFVSASIWRDRYDGYLRITQSLEGCPSGRQHIEFQGTTVSALSRSDDFGLNGNEQSRRRCELPYPPDDRSRGFLATDYALGVRVVAQGCVWVCGGSCQGEKNHSVSFSAGSIKALRWVCDGIELMTIRFVNYAMHRVRLLRYHGIIPFIVFDGGPLPAKKGTEDTRAL